MTEERGEGGGERDRVRGDAPTPNPFPPRPFLSEPVSSRPFQPRSQASSDEDSKMALSKVV